jgi:hypothetical protein
LAKDPKKSASGSADGVVSIDFTKAVTLENLPVPGPYLCTVSAFELGQSAAGSQKVHVELTVVEPSEWSRRKLFDDISLENEYTLGRLMTLLVSLGEDKEKVKSKDYKLNPDDMFGRQVAVFIKNEESEAYGVRSRIKRVAPAAVFSQGSGF